MSNNNENNSNNKESQKEISAVDFDPASFSSVTRPQDDLFRYVNGPWIDTYTLPEDKPMYGAFHKLAEDAEKQIRDILENENCPAKKSQTLYRNYLDTASIEKAGITPIKSDLDAVDAAETKEDLVRTIGALNPYGGPDAMFYFGVYGDPKDPKTNIMHIEQSGLGLPDEAYYREDNYAPIRTEYVKMVASLLRLAGYGDATTTQAQAERFLNVETKIASYHWDNVATRDSQKTYNPYNYADLAKTLEALNLDAFLDATQKAYDNCEEATNQPINLREAFNKVVVHEPSFMEGLNKIWQEADLEDLKLWARVHVILRWASLLSEDFAQARFDFYGKVLSGATKQRDRWKRAVGVVDDACGEEVGREYVRLHFPESSKEYMQGLVDNLINAYRESISHSSWLGEETKAKALEKISKFEPNIGYTNHWVDYSALNIKEDAGLVENMREVYRFGFGKNTAKAGKPVDREEWQMTPQTVNAYYDPLLNVIVFPAAILQPPFFNPSAPDAANYGAIGAVIGHEIGHGFDDQGCEYDGDGMLNNWWTEEDKTNFSERTKKLIEQYNAFTPTQLIVKYSHLKSKEERNAMPHVNGALTIGENIGDLSGVTIALKAYAFALQKSKGQEIDGSDDAIRETLLNAPEVDGFTALQRFFLSYALVWRSKARNEIAEQLLQIDPHSPAECRTNGIARNVDLFYDAFSVKEGDEMWLDPAERAHIW
uniref:M13 family metallopeptidase n=1 Tax=uncultured Gardnerella sp. TaxID=293424 RepID=UPI00258F0CD9|nr:M13-type metalloendopeptidase [uncultured Gardnerella sp.]